MNRMASSATQPLSPLSECARPRYRPIELQFTGALLEIWPSARAPPDSRQKFVPLVEERIEDNRDAVVYVESASPASRVATMADGVRRHRIPT